MNSSEQQAQASGFHFQSLTPDLILDAIESLQIYPETGLLALNSYENRVYQFRCDRGQRYVVKFYRPERWTDAQIIEEHQFALDLLSEEIPVAAPLAIDGQTLHHYQGYRFTLFPSIGGRSFEVDNLDQLEAVGRFIGRIHQWAGSKPFQYRESLTPQNMGRDSVAWLRESGHVPESLQLPYFTVVEQVLALVEQQWQQVNAPMIRLHGDLHPGNILWTPDGPGFVDLDDAKMGPQIQDLWMMLAGDHNEQRLQLDVLLEAYEEFCEFDTRQLALIEPLRALRMIQQTAWVSRRWQDPAFPMSFPWFGQEQYWEQQILAFKEQLSTLQAPPITLYSAGFNG
ncbi:serine/threonine protein kinase [Shewanella marina]|uniref:serine/threonine protein kinase n=1 Tax=Shewanella marina TaxID=487319 RepID=UPI0004712C3E|nr:serine/threonine protein kinase [Shewanella marina]